ncbi:MAG: PAS domain-containing protein [Verrucomicrobiota bacterium]
MPTPVTAVPSDSRALLVEPDAGVRQRVAAGLRKQGMEVVECGDMDEGRELYRGQRLVIAPLNGNNSAMKQFVAWVRAEAGTVQPWIIAMGTDHQLMPGETAAHYGVNDLLTAPMDTADLVRRLESVGMGLMAEITPVSAENEGECSAGPLSGQRPAGFPPGGWRGASAAVMLENFPAAVAVMDPSMHYLAVNQQWFTLFQLPAMTLTGLSHYGIFPDLHPAWRHLYEQGLESGVKQSSDDLLLLPDGSEKLMHWEIQPWRASCGLISGLVLTCAPLRAAGPGGPPSAAAVLEPVSFPAGGSSQPDHGENPEPVSGDWMSPAALRRDCCPDIASKEEDGECTGFTVLFRSSADTGVYSAVPAAPSGTITDSMPAGSGPGTAPPHADPSFREMAEAAPFGMVLLDDEAQVLYANPQHRAVLGSSVTETGGMADWLQRACPGDDEESRQATLEEWWEKVWRRHNSLTCSLRTAEGLVKEIEFRPAPLSGDRLLLTIFDVTDARLDEQAIRSSEARHRGLFQQSSAAFAIMNAAGNLMDVNPAFEALTGCLRHEMRRASLADFLTPEAMRRLRPVEGAADVPFASTVTHRSGRITPVNIAVAAIRNEQGHPVFTACILIPLPAGNGGTPPDAVPAVPVTITQIFPATDWGGVTPDLLFLLNDSGGVIDHNRSRDFEALMPPGVRFQDQFLENALPHLTAPLPLDEMMERLLDEPGHEVRCAFPLRLPGDHAERSVEARMVRMPEESEAEAETAETGEPGPPVTFGLTLRDISRVAGQVMRVLPDPGALLRHLRTPAVLANERGRILALNPAAETFFGYPSADLVDHGLHRLFLPEDPAAFSANLSRHLAENQEWCAVTPFTRRDGSTGHCEAELTLCTDEAAGFRGLILLARAAADPAVQRLTDGNAGG